MGELYVQPSSFDKESGDFIDIAKGTGRLRLLKEKQIIILYWNDLMSIMVKRLRQNVYGFA